MILKENLERNTTSSSMAGSRGNSLTQVLYKTFFLSAVSLQQTSGVVFQDPLA
jgi:hypothetical protein